MTDLINANLSATETNKATRYLIDDLNLDVQRGELTRNGEALTLPKLSYDLLVALAQAAPALLSQQELMQKVWPDRVIGDETLKQRVKLLRKSLGDNASDPQYIEAVRGRGYRLIPQVTCECVIKRSPSVMLDLSANDLFPNLLSLSLHRWWRKASHIGLLLFTAIVLTALATSFFYQQQTQPQPNSKGLSVNTLLEKKVGKSTFHLYQRGREYYKRYRAQDNKIAINFYQQAIIAIPSFSEAYAGLSQAYSQAYFQFGGNEQDKQFAIDNAYLAISYNNNSADAYKALGTAYYVSGWLSKSINVLLRGAEIAPNDREILTNLGFIYSEQGKFTQALFWHKKALQVAPDYAVGMLHVGITFQRTKQYQLALKWYKKAFSQQPDYLLTTYHLSHYYTELKQFEKADKIIRQQLQLQPEQPLLLEALADNYIFQGNLAKALQYYQQVVDKRMGVETSHANIMVKLLSSNSDHHQLKDSLIKPLVTLHLSGNEKPKTSLYLAKVYAKLNDNTFSIRYLVQALEQGQVLNYQIDSSPFFNEVKTLARYKKLIRNQETVITEKVAVDHFFYNN
jgi:DNA-binding winged helix-turn-helix (wHTH) protein/Flp pilus assembly protein TadD